MMVSANSANCVPAEPTVAGTSALKNRRTSSSQVSAWNDVITPARQASPPTRAACSTPEISTPQAAAWPALGNSQATASVAIIATLSSVDAAAAAANRLSALRMPPHSVTSVISSK